MATRQAHDSAKITGYHAHVYYSAETKAAAARLRRRVRNRFDVVVGRWRNRKVGPHPQWSFQVAFGTAAFAEIVPWMALNRDGLDILVHPETGDAFADHTDFAIWLGKSHRIRAATFK